VDSSSERESDTETVSASGSGDEDNGGGAAPPSPERRQAAIWRGLRRKHPDSTWRPAGGAAPRKAEALG